MIFLHFYHFDDIDGVHLLLLYVQDKNKKKGKEKKVNDPNFKKKNSIVIGCVWVGGEEEKGY